MLRTLLESLGSPNVRWVMVGAVLLGMSSGMLGAFALLRRRSLMGDVLAHAALPGVCVAFLVVGGKHTGAFMVGAVVLGLIATYVLHLLRTHTRLAEDTGLAVVLSVFFGLGIVLLTWIQKGGAGSQAGLDKFLFGQAASLVGRDLYMMLAVASVLCLACTVLFKEFKLLCFDPSFSVGLGRPMRALDFILMLLIVLAVVVGLQAVGVVLMAAMLITPAAAARFWTERLDVMVALAAACGAAAGVIGTCISTLGARLPTGPLIVLSATGLFVASWVIAPRRGLLSKGVRLARVRGRVSRENALRAIYEHAEENDDWECVFSPEEVLEHRPDSARTLERMMHRLGGQGLVRPVGNRWRFTPEGLAEAYGVVRNHRLWEMFLMHERELGVGHADRDADLVEHFLPPETVAELERLLEVHRIALKLPPSVHPTA